MLDRFRRHSLVAAFLLASTGPLLAQGARWEWPEKSKSLEVLPADTSADRLRAVMRGFTGALGVRCNYCHVGEEGKPLSTFDFASDANPNKDRAREMMRMLGAIDGHLQKIDPSGTERVGVRCQTCHGQPDGKGSQPFTRVPGKDVCARCHSLAIDRMEARFGKRDDCSSCHPNHQSPMHGQAYVFRQATTKTTLE